jgi:hypothetical protein
MAGDLLAQLFDDLCLGSTACRPQPVEAPAAGWAEGAGAAMHGEHRDGFDRGGL